MRFLKTYLATLFFLSIFVVCGGYTLFNFREHFWVAIAACAFIIAVLVRIFISQDERIEQLEAKIKEIEEKI